MKSLKFIAIAVLFLISISISNAATKSCSQTLGVDLANPSMVRAVAQAGFINFASNSFNEMNNEDLYQLYLASTTNNCGVLGQDTVSKIIDEIIKDNVMIYLIGGASTGNIENVISTTLPDDEEVTTTTTSTTTTITLEGSHATINVETTKNDYKRFIYKDRVKLHFDHGNYEESIWVDEDETIVVYDYLMYNFEIIDISNGQVKFNIDNSGSDTVFFSEDTQHTFSVATPEPVETEEYTVYIDAIEEYTEPYDSENIMLSQNSRITNTGTQTIFGNNVYIEVQTENGNMVSGLSNEEDVGPLNVGNNFNLASLMNDYLEDITLNTGQNYKILAMYRHANDDEVEVLEGKIRDESNLFTITNQLTSKGQEDDESTTTTSSSTTSTSTTTSTIESTTTTTIAEPSEPVVRGYWRFEGNLDDSSPSDNDLTYTSEPVMYGIANNGICPDGYNHLSTNIPYVTLYGDEYFFITDENQEGLDLGNRDYIIEAWLRTSQTNSNPPWGINIIAKHDASSGWGIGNNYYYQSTWIGRPQWKYNGEHSNEITSNEPYVLSNGDWHHLAVIVSHREPELASNAIRLYVDGEFKGSENLLSEENLDNLFAFTIGADSEGNGKYIGDITRVKLTDYGYLGIAPNERNSIVAGIFAEQCTSEDDGKE